MYAIVHGLLIVGFCALLYGAALIVIDKQEEYERRQKNEK